MRPIPPVFLPSAAAPEFPDQPGIAIAAPLWKTRKSAWLHGVLTLSEEEVGEKTAPWINSLFVTAVTEIGCQPNTENISNRRPYVINPPTWIDGGDLRHLPFNIDLNAILPFPLQNEPVWIYVTARNHESEPLRVENEDVTDLSLVKTQTDKLILAYALYADGDAAKSAESFIEAFEDEGLRRDLDSGHLFNGACAAALAFEADGSQEKFLKSALEWRGEDLYLRAERKAAISMRITDPAISEEVRSSLLLEQELHSLHFESLRTDPDLETLRKHS